MTEREEKFEKMLMDIQHNYLEIVEKMEKLKSMPGRKRQKSSLYVKV